MSAQRFVGANSREAMNQVRLALGEDALILSSRMIDEGVEIMALIDEVQPSEPDDSPLPVSPLHAATAYASQVNTYSTSTVHDAPVAPAITSGPAMDFAALSERLLNEIQDMRQLIDRKSERPSASQGCRPQLLKWLLDAGFSTSLSEEILGTIPAQLEGPDATPARLQTWLEQKLGSHLSQLGDEAELFDDTGVIALVGPTGVGKTTTTAKLAARYVMRHGASQVALVTTDSFRIGAHEQLRIYADLLGVELHALTPAAALDQVLAGLIHKRLVIIDTVGMSQRDQRLMAQMNQLGSSGRSLRLMLVINAASHGDTLEEVVQTYRNAAHVAGCSLDDCIIGKCDEAARLGPALDTVIRHGLRLNYLSTGQQVPEDLQLPSNSSVLQQAVDISRPSLFATKPGKSTALRLDALVRGLMGQSRLVSTLRDTLKQRISGFGELLDVWPLTGLPQALQNQRWATFTSTQEHYTPARPGGLLLWGAPRSLPGATWNMPLLAADNAGQLKARPWLAHRLPIGQQPRLNWCQHRWPAHRHLWAGCPDTETLDALSHAGQTWLSAIKGSQRVEYQGERQRLDALVIHSEDFGFRELRYRGRNVRLSLRHLPVNRVSKAQESLRAWFGTLHDSHSGQLLGQRWWLAGEHMGARSELDNQALNLTLQLTHDELATLTARTWKQLAEIQPHQHAELRQYLAAGLAATAVRLTNTNDDWAFQARAQLLGLLAKKHTGNAAAILDGLLHLLTVSDAFTRMDACA
ncbi:flagellar biosynthesis protein FlhF [Pseudomonas cichorii]|nr:flagellar biosynthesis protein FlhF [Pseudomonas cichorii]MBX8534190.1 flagellar biosynthesis protein FlhF [Pseudomonas cichorii]MBX8570479.1 flagellar biosynthesis protein FlhF [Pseudomonas cichorii]MBX8602064.1 flagellar biosynthesis protein FlhF [Pseudomonas cichorii]